MDEAEARSHAEHVERGGALVSVRASDAMDAHARSILKGETLATDPTLTGTSGTIGTGTTSTYSGGLGKGDLADNAVTRAADSTFGTNMSGKRPD